MRKSESNVDSLYEKVKNEFPESPGVYLFKKSGKVIYIGKAKNLKKRVLSYFRKNTNSKAKKIITEADELDYIVVNSEKEALLLEANLIFKEKPVYNVMLKETKWYPYIFISNERYPTVKVVREKNEIGEYYGPYTDIGFVRKLLNLSYRLFKIRSCSMNISLNKLKKPCLEYHLGMCSAPCAGKINEREYKVQIDKFRKFLNGDTDQIVKDLEKEMVRLSKLLEFEKAANIRDLIFGIREIFEPQFVVLNDNVDVDGIFFKKGVGAVLRIRKGMLLGKLSFEFDGKNTDFLKQLYFGLKLPLPDGILTNFEVDPETASMFDNKYVGKPRDEHELKVLELARLNWKEEYRKIRDTEIALKRLKEIIGLSHLPRRIEGIDISHTQGLFTVASLVVFIDGRPLKSEYRRYRFDALNYPNDFLAIKKVVIRRYQKRDLPDLLFIDGGKGQVNAAIEALEEIGKRCPVVGIAKEDERIVLPGSSDDLKLPLDDIALRLLIKVRDESHRFANTFHSKLREKRIIESKLDNIPGVGPKRKKALLKKFGSVKRIKKASVDEIKKIVKSEKIALLIKERL